MLLNSLRYSYLTDNEELPGQRQIIVTASDGIYTDSLSVFIDVQILNNNSPQLSLGGRDTANFVEGAVSVPIGMFIMHVEN